ncbi:Clp1/GlmU family protein [Thermatribacter velox]|uniref:Clp1/GlmU family protein n=1 Tax=Thermatribacter velox TaxID=3039681 RepID=A0ABZ2Y8R8_9BACT
MGVELSWPEEWVILREKLTSFEGTILVVAPVDRGKTTLVRLICDFFRECGRSCALVDSDLGQSVVGPPTTVGMLPPGSQLGSQEALFTPYFRFVGDTTPSRHLLLTALSVFELVQMARALSQVVVVDTCGLFRGLEGLYLKMLKIKLLMPQLVIGLGNEEEFRVLKVLKGRDFLILPTPEGVKNKGAEERKARRKLLFAEYFSRGRKLVLELSRLRLFAPLSPYFYLQQALQAEWGMVFKVGRKRYHLLCSEKVQQDFPLEERSGYWLLPEDMNNLLCCLYSKQLREIGLGIIRKIDFAKGKMEIWGTTLSQAEPHFVVCGDLKVNPQGEEMGRLSWKILR